MSSQVFTYLPQSLQVFTYLPMDLYRIVDNYVSLPLKFANDIIFYNDKTDRHNINIRMEGYLDTICFQKTIDNVPRSIRSEHSFEGYGFTIKYCFDDGYLEEKSGQLYHDKPKKDRLCILQPSINILY